jgi:hypothetical protein
MAFCQELMNVSPSDSESEGEASDNEPMLFGGDAFGSSAEYMDDEFGQLGQSDGNPLIYANDEEENYGLGAGNDDFHEQEDEYMAAQFADLEQGWEPERPGARVTPTTTNDDNGSELPPGADSENQEINVD